MFKVFLDKKKCLERITEVFNSGFINEGEQVLEFKEKLKSVFDHEHVVPVNSCTSALTMALKLAGVEAGDEVISTAMTCVATNAPITFLGAKVVWADIDRTTGNIDPKEIESKITEKTKAIMCVNWAGLPCDFKNLNNICKEYNIKLIQDAAHSFGTKYNDQECCHFADYTCYSFQAIKHMTSGDGGALVCKSKDDYLRARGMKWYGFDRFAVKDEKGNWKGQRWDADIAEVGNKFNMNNISAVIGLCNLEHHLKIVNAHKRNAKLYGRLFSEVSHVTSLVKQKDSDPAYWIYTVLLDEELDRDTILEKLNALGVNAGLVHVPNHNYTCFEQSRTALPETEYFAKNQISLPCGWWLKVGDIVDIVGIIKNVIDEQSID